MTIPDLRINDFDYNLPPERIAQYPAENRDASKLLVLKNGMISENIFANIDQEIPPDCLLVFNDTRVIRARLIFSKPTGATIEVFCLEPMAPVADIQQAFAQTGSCSWNCLVGNVKRWKNGILRKIFTHEGISFALTALKKKDLGEGCFEIEFRWEPEIYSFSEILEYAGLVPLPPYIERASGSADSVRYQTIYAKTQGSVAAPTAGLHFTTPVLERLREKNITFVHVTLHVGIGTFRPVSVERIDGHTMHSERISVSLSTIKELMIHRKKPVIAVGTTSVRTLESLYWAGARILTNKKDFQNCILQWDAYDDVLNQDIPCPEALGALAGYLEENGAENFEGQTQLMIAPGYKFRVVDGMITNFHLPKSTLLLLIAAFIKEEWKRVYEYALSHDFRFLSYGDACLFYP